MVLMSAHNALHLHHSCGVNLNFLRTLETCMPSACMASSIAKLSRQRCQPKRPGSVTVLHVVVLRADMSSIDMTSFAPHPHNNCRNRREKCTKRPTTKGGSVLPYWAIVHHLHGLPQHPLHPPGTLSRVHG